MSSVIPICSKTIACAKCGEKWREDIPTGFKAVQCPGCQWWVNEHGNVVSKHTCQTCGRDFCVIPPIPVGVPRWENCLADDCASYDPARDADKYFG